MSKSDVADDCIEACRPDQLKTLEQQSSNIVSSPVTPEVLENAFSSCASSSPFLFNNSKSDNMVDSVDNCDRSASPASETNLQADSNNNSIKLIDNNLTDKHHRTPESSTDCKPDGHSSDNNAGESTPLVDSNNNEYAANASFLSSDSLCTSASSGFGSYWQRSPNSVPASEASANNEVTDSLFLSSMVNRFNYDSSGGLGDALGNLNSTGQNLAHSVGSSTGSAAIASLSNQLSSQLNISLGNSLSTSSGNSGQQMLPTLQLSPSLGNGGGNGFGNAEQAGSGRRAITGAHSFGTSSPSKQSYSLNATSSGPNLFKSGSFAGSSTGAWSQGNISSGLLSAGPPGGSGGSSGGSVHSAGSPQSPINLWAGGSPTSPLQQQQSQIASAGGWSAYPVGGKSNSGQLSSSSRQQMGTSVSPLKKSFGTMHSQINPAMNQHLAAQINHHVGGNINPMMVSPKYRGTGGNMSNASGRNAGGSNVMLLMGMGMSSQTGGSKLYDMGSAGSESQTSSSAESSASSLRDHNMLLNYQNNIGMTGNTAGTSGMDNMRFSLEHHLMDIVRSTPGDMHHMQQSQQHQPIQPVMQMDSHYKAGRSMNRRRGKSPFFTGVDQENQMMGYENNQIGGAESTERFSRKVFVGGLPPDIDEEEIKASFRRFGNLTVDWPHKAESKSYFPPKGYAFLLFQDEASVQALIEICIAEDDKLYLCVSSPTIRDKPVQIRPWRLSDADFVLDASMPLDPRKTVFVGGVPRPLKAVELAMIMDRLYGGVCYAGIDTDPELKYPKGAGRVAFSNQQSYIAAISARFVQLQHADIEKRVEVKPYVLDDQICDECGGSRCGGKFAPFFCANVTCLQYYCEHCWTQIHSQAGREYHKPLVKEGADRPRALPFRC